MATFEYCFKLKIKYYTGENKWESIRADESGVNDPEK